MSITQKKKSISVVINTYNEEENIKQCLNKLTWVDEIIIVDMHSSDKTVDNAKKYTDKIFFSKKYPYVEPVRNFSISKATKDWILIVDADESFSDLKGYKIRNLIQNTEVDGYLFPRRAYINNNCYLKHGYFYPDYQLRLFKNNGKFKYSESVHRQPDSRDLKTKRINSIEIFHNSSHGKYDSFFHFFRFINYIIPDEIEQSKLNINTLYLLWLIPLDLVRHIYRSFIKLSGYLDGYAGFRAAVIYSLYKTIVNICAVFIRLSSNTNEYSYRP